MADILISGLCNIETCLKIQEFPLHYNAVNYPFHQISSALSGVGLNVATALNHLGNRVNFLSIAGRDDIGKLIKEKLEERGIYNRARITRNLCKHYENF